MSESPQITATMGMKKGSQYGSPTLIEYLLTTFNNFQPHFVTKAHSRVAYFLAKVNITFIVFFFQVIMRKIENS